jgi:hypothetical protein
VGLRLGRTNAHAELLAQLFPPLSCASRWIQGESRVNRQPRRLKLFAALLQIVLQHLRGAKPNKEAFEKALTSTFTDEFCKLTLASAYLLVT